MRRAIFWLTNRVEYVAAGFVLAALTTLAAWWSIFFRRTIAVEAGLSHELLELRLSGHPEAIAQASKSIDERTQRLMLMVTGETAVFVAGLALGIVSLVLVARRRRQARQRMEQLLRLTSHELKTPIAGVRALLQSLQLGSVPEEQRAQFVQMGIAETDRLEHLAETILAYQRAVTRGEQALEAHSALAMLDEVLEHRKKTGVVETVVRGEVQAAQVRADRDGFRVILENLLDNARKYGGGKSTVAARVDGRRWKLSVSDAGQGFEPQDANRLFDPFRREKMKSVTHGSGLGLSIARQLARQMGGDLTARSEGPQKGATFELQLPVETGAQAANPGEVHG